MKKTIFIIFGLLLSGLLILFVTAICDERGGSALFRPEGSIYTGEKFGVNIGEDIEKADTTVQSSGWKYSERQLGGKCVRHSYSAGQSMYVYYDKSWRRGTLYLISRLGKIQSLEWYFQPFTPEL
jgi:hypothetical protein